MPQNREPQPLCSHPNRSCSNNDPRKSLGEEEPFFAAAAQATDRTIHIFWQAATWHQQSYAHNEPAAFLLFFHGTYYHLEMIH